ncbi:MAG: TM2 domain-containing protein [Anaerolineae bacterium]|nr:TM2 domain-containing protein [Anaerolineae bacterium]
MMTLECPSCGAPISMENGEQILTCAYCGRKLLLGKEYLTQTQQKAPSAVLQQETYSPFSYTTTLALAILLGIFGAHRFYTGHLAVGAIQLLTSGGVLIWWLWDVVSILNGSFRDVQGRLLKRPQRLNVWGIGAAVYLISLFVLTALSGDGRVGLAAAVIPALALVVWLRRKASTE